MDQDRGRLVNGQPIDLNRREPRGKADDAHPAPHGDRNRTAGRGCHLMPVRCPLGHPVQPQGTVQRDAKGMPHLQGSAQVDERVAVAVRAGMSAGGELIDAALSGGQKPACRAQPGGEHLGRRAQSRLLGEGRQLLEADKQRLAQLQFGHERRELP